MRLLKNLIKYSLLTVCSFSATAGCSSPVGSSRAASTRTIVFKHGKIFGDSGPLKTLLREFEVNNPGVSVLDEELPSSTDEQHQFYVINLQGESASFDVFALDVIWISEFARAGWLRNLSDSLPVAAREDFFSATIDAVTYREQIYALPWVIGAGLLYYRKDLLEKYGFAPPQSWTDVVAAASQITAKESNLHGFVWQGKQYEGLVCNSLEYLWTFGGKVIEDGHSVINSKENINALKMMRSMIYDFHITPEFVTTLTEEPSRRLFGAGRALFMRNWPYAWSLFEQTSSPVYNKVGVTTIPRGPAGESYATLGGWHLGVNKYSRSPELAQKLARFLTSAYAAKKLALGTGHEPTRRSLYKDPELLRKHPFKRKLKDIFEKARPRPVTPYYMMISQVMQREFSAAISRIKTPQHALVDAHDQIEHILAIEKQ
ncbi:MAG: ABC transporter substrate-binding protein [Bdellovibrionales bacterium]|nr:ABC transporter substrate-binding protein [Bdellovibrionales bacterium]